MTGRAAHRHPLALLALLAAAPGHSASRDKLIGYLWPEAETARGRHRLSVALHVLRQALGDETLRSHSDGLLLDPSRVWTDLGAFSAALEEGRLEQAVSLYEGPFLDGFFLSGAPEFERWVEAERSRLADLYTAALERLGNEAERGGDHGAAVVWRRQLAAEDPLSTPVALGLMRALRDVGDPVGALRHGRAHAAMLAGELGLPPDPEVVALTDELSAELGSRPAAQTAPAPTRPAHAPIDDGARRPARPVFAAAVTVLLATLALLAWGGRARPTAGATGGVAAVAVLPVLDGGASSADERLGRRIAAQVGATLAIVPDLQVVSADSLPGSDRDALRRAGELARAAGATRLLAVDVRRMGNRTRVAAELVDARTGSREWSDRFDRRVRDDDRFVREVSLTIADSLRLRLAPYRPKVYTQSERAYERFLEGVYRHRQVTERDLWKALQLYREGYEEDEQFALAHAISANAYVALVGLGLPADVGFREARQHALKALAIDSTLAEGHVALAMIELWHDWDFAEAERLLRRAIMLYPTLPQARSYYGHLLLRIGESPEDALIHVRRALELDPLNAARSHTLERSLFLARRYDQVIEQNRVTRRLAPDRELGAPGSNVADAYRALGRYQDALREYQRVRERTETTPSPGLAITYARMGQPARARALLPRLEARAEEGAVPPETIAAVHASLGDPEAAFHWLERAYAQRSRGLLDLRVDPDMDPLRDDARFDELRRRVGLPP